MSLYKVNGPEWRRHEILSAVEYYMCLCLQVSVDVFKGFPDEDSIVNYTLNQAYQDNVSVFASESLCPGYDQSC